MTLEALYNELKDIPGKKIVILGSCYSGNFINVGNDYSEFYVITSALDSQSAWVVKTDPEDPRPIFESSLLEGAGLSWNGEGLGGLPADANSDGYVTLYELYEFCEDYAWRHEADWLALYMDNHSQTIQFTPGDDYELFHLWGK